ncbi:hypothetical protein [Foetidibacter luteolus]|uniref:hypothetical protein n=1 Tax=Foetidibacter luteolus TaxID=2608880 RepID=UPI00129ADF39|nr:hypothetical protein [Foetidibacter luteolus]
MKTRIPFLSYLLVTLFFITSGCKKVIDFIDRPGDCCRIEKISYEPIDSWSPDKLEVVFTYNKYGDPLSAVHSSDVSGVVNHFFKYDKLHRLTGYMYTYGKPPGFLSWEKYTYTNDPRVIIDSLFSYGDGGWPGDSPTDYFTVDVFKIILDNRGRIVKWWDIDFTYDAQGNLEYPGETYTYDNKVNIRRTSRTWMFIERDFSINNVKQSLGSLIYNKARLPQHLYDAHTPWAFLQLEYNNAYITYSCDDAADAQGK